MLSGSQALGSIDLGLREAAEDLRQTNEQLSKATSAQAERQRQEAAAYRELAGLRLDALQRDAVIQDLEASEQRALALLDDHQTAVEALDKKLSGHAEAVARLGEERVALTARMDPLAEKIDEAEAKTQARLEKDPVFAERLAAAKAAEEVIKRAERKAEQARENRVEKGKPYEDDSLFIYLWKRHYGTARYGAFPLARWLDGKVARHCGYAAARPNYAMLLDLPEKLGEHVEEVRDRAEQQAQELEGLERAAMAADGVADLATDFTALEAELETLDDKIAKQEMELATTQRQHAHLVGGESESFQKALETLGRSFRQESLRSLYRDAVATSMPDDDILVERLQEIAESKRDLERQTTHLKAMRASQDTRVRELDGIRNEFRRQRFDSGNSVFTDPTLIALVLSQFMKGGISSRGVWDTLQKQQHFNRRRSNPGFGSGGLSRGGGRSRGGGSIRGGSLGPIGGGFRTGGRMGGGGGGFRTGGSF